MGSGEAAQDNGATDMALEPQGPGSPEELPEQQGATGVCPSQLTFMRCPWQLSTPVHAPGDIAIAH